jgi:uncharacterized protein (TIGR02145 family)
MLSYFTFFAGYIFLMGSHNMKHILFFIGIFCYPFILQAQWYPAPMPTTQNFFSITFTDTLHAYIPVSDGPILESFDGGITWQTVPTGTTNPLADIRFPTASTGYSVGWGGAIVKTINAGNTWSVINSPTTNVLRGVFFLNPDTGFICGQGECIYRTTNGGTTWVQQNTGSYWLRKFSFPTPQIGYCDGDNMLIYKTTDGGLTWNQLPGSGGANLTDISFLTVDTGYVCGYNGYVAKSFNGGQTWQVLNTGTTTNFEGLWFFNSQAGYCVGTPGIIMKTTDGGATWAQETSGTNVTLEHLYFIHPNKGFICGFVGTLLENCLPAPGPITGPSPVCQGDTGKIYSVAPVTDATGYHWNLPPGVIITSGSNTNSITVTYTATSVSGSFSVYAFKSYCNGNISPSFPVTVNPSPLITANGPDQVCFNADYNYTTQPGMSNYSWNISSGGIITAGGTPTDNTVAVTWNSVGSQTVSVNYTNVNGCIGAAPAIINVNVNPLPVPTITGPAFPCVISTGNVYSTAAGKTNYQWSISAGGVINSGGTTTDNTVTVTWNTAGTQHVYLSYTDTDGCNANAPADYIIITTPGPPVNVTITASSYNVCSGTQVTFTATPAYGGTTPVYQWKVNGIISGTDSSGFTYAPVNNDVVTCILTSSLMECISNNPATSNGITMVVNPILPVTISIVASANPSCQGYPITFTATPTYGGTIPSYQWKVNGINSGTNSSVYTYNPANGDQVYCILTSSELCTSGNPASSSTITMVVNSVLTAGVSITALSNPFCPGSSVTFTATPVNGGSAPAYQWKLNGANAGTNSHTFTYNPADGDSVRCIMTSNLNCVTGNPVSSAKIIMSGTLAPIVTFTSCFDTITLIIAKPIKLKGGIPLGGAYSGPGVNSLTGIFIPSAAGTGTKTITYSYTNVVLCTATKSIHIIVQSAPAFTCGNDLTDIRVNKVYPTVQIGSQCWFASNLNYGTVLASTQDQRDNCISEKYCYNDNPTNCTNQGGLYQWDELMLYDDTPGDQGLCPPAWHIPSENDWNTLFANWTNNGFAGSPLKYSGYSGFIALLSGARYINKNWDLQGFATFFWSSTPRSSTQAWAHGMNDPDPSVSIYPASRVNAFSIRCLKD